jgi:hypothetical protein
MTVEVILRDFDGSRTIVPAEIPLRDVISTEETDFEITIGKIYTKTDEEDAHGRTIYAEHRH